jgi:hypothetical protein
VSSDTVVNLHHLAPTVAEAKIGLGTSMFVHHTPRYSMRSAMPSSVNMIVGKSSLAPTNHR